MTEEQKKRRDELAEAYKNDHVDLSGGGSFFSKQEASFYSYQAGYDAGFADANAELTRKLEVAKKALIQSKTRLEYLETVQCHFSSGKSKCNIENGMSLSSVKEALKELD